MSQPGMGVLLHYMFGPGENDRSPKDYYGRLITRAKLEDDRLKLTFDDGVTIHVFDDGQSCCESRYITTDDDVAWLEGRRLRSIAVKEGPPRVDEDDYTTHEQVFLEVGTQDGSITFANHNEHNGYYGGFVLTVHEVKAEHKLAEEGE